MQQENVWDFPTRAFHWLLVAALIFQYVSGEILDDAMQWHFYVGYFTLALILFRLIWGFTGHYYSRFTSFIVGPKTIVAYVKGQSNARYLSHNPLGALSVVALLTLVATQALSGLFIDDDIFFQGPWHHVVSNDAADTANLLHANIYKAIMAFVTLHIGAVLFYQFAKKQKLIQSMLTGQKPSKRTKHKFSVHLWWKFIIVAALSAVAVYLAVEVLPPPVEDDFYGF